MHKVLHKRLPLHAYKVQLVSELKPHDRPQREAFATEILSRIDEDNDYLKHVVFFLMKLPFIHVARLIGITYAFGDQNTHMLRLNMNETAPK